MRKNYIFSNAKFAVMVAGVLFFSAAMPTDAHAQCYQTAQEVCEKFATSSRRGYYFYTYGLTCPEGFTQSDDNVCSRDAVHATDEIGETVTTYDSCDATYAECVVWAPTSKYPGDTNGDMGTGIQCSLLTN